MNKYPELNLFQLFIYSNDNLIENNLIFKQNIVFMIQSKIILKEPLNFSNIKDVGKYVSKHFEMDFILTKSKSTDELRSELLN